MLSAIITLSPNFQGTFGSPGQVSLKGNFFVIFGNLAVQGEVGWGWGIQEGGGGERGIQRDSPTSNPSLKLE